MTLHNPKEYEADEKGAVKAVVLDVMQLGEPDASGRRRPEATGETITLECDQVIVAVGVSPNPLVPQSIEGLELGRKNTIAVNDQMQSSIEEIYAGGDIVRGGATVILAMGDGRKAALNAKANDQVTGILFHTFMVCCFLFLSVWFSTMSRVHFLIYMCGWSTSLTHANIGAKIVNVPYCRSTLSHFNTLILTLNASLAENV